jgi:hypothetical protein
VAAVSLILAAKLGTAWLLAGLDSVRDDLASVVRSVLAPAQVSVWVSRRG